MYRLERESMFTSHGNCVFLSGNPSPDDTCPECGRSGPIDEVTHCPHGHMIVHRHDPPMAEPSPKAERVPEPLPVPLAKAA
jgi:hypothetical protein